MNRNKQLGQQGEEQATKFLKDLGYEIVERNYRTKYGEIDIICSKKNILYCVEVKTRSSKAYGYPSEAITPKKLQRMILMGQIAAQNFKVFGEVKLFVIEILAGEINLIEVEP